MKKSKEFIEVENTVRENKIDHVPKSKTPLLKTIWQQQLHFKDKIK